MEVEQPTTIEEAFDFETKKIHDWEVVKIRKALKLEELVIDLDSHAAEQIRKRPIDYDDLPHVVQHGRAVSKDLPDNEDGRWEGINFEGMTPGLKGKRLRVKVGWRDGFYEYGTAHLIK